MSSKKRIENLNDFDYIIKNKLTIEHSGTGKTIKSATLLSYKLVDLIKFLNSKWFINEN